MAIAAIQPELADMVLVAERDRLRDRLSHACQETGTENGGAQHDGQY
jgi:hypothetical protein